MAQDRIYPAGVQTFSDIIEQGMVYVDKTALVYRIVKIHQMKRFKTDVTSLDDIFAFASSFDRPTDDMTDALPLLYQSGYLTIKKFDPMTSWHP